MTIKTMAVKNIRGNLNKYAMYYVSNVIVVTIFFIFANFIFNPELDNHKFKGDNLGGIASQLMYLCEFVIIIFAIVFSAYSITSFLKAREKEFGLLAMFGLTKGQIRRYVMFENVIISVGSIITGLFFGILFSKLFFLGVSAVLNFDSELPFSISIRAIKISLLSFLILFNGISFFTGFKIKNNNIVELLKGERIPKTTPKFSVIKAVISIVLIISGYYVGITSKSAIVYTMFPILLIVIIGTYFLFTQFSVFFTDRLQKSKSVYYKGINLITLSQIIYKLKDNSKILFITSILSGITLASAITVYSLQMVSIASVEENCPQDIGFLEQGVNSHKVVSPQKVEEVLSKYKFHLKFKNKIELIKAENADRVIEAARSQYGEKINKKDFNIISEKDYNKLASQYSKTEISLKRGQTVIYSYDMVGGVLNQNMKLPFKYRKHLNLKVNGVIRSWQINENKKGGIINGDSKNTNTVIISDSEFKELWNRSLDKEKYFYYGYNISNYLKASAPVTEIKNAVPQNQRDNFNERVINASSFMQFISVFLFIGTFVAVIFFVASGSILYFKMFNEIQKDKQEFIGLKKIGVTQEEIKKIVSTQSFTMFFLPLIIALIHAAFAVKSLGLLHAEYFAFIAGIYLILQVIYFLFAKWMYVKQINSWGI